MKISVIPEDKTISVDGVALQFDFTVWPSNLRALQWNGASGTMEFSTGPQQWFDNQALVQPYIDAYQAEAARHG